MYIFYILSPIYGIVRFCVITSRQTVVAVNFIEIQELFTLCSNECVLFVMDAFLINGPIFATRHGVMACYDYHSWRECGLYELSSIQTKTSADFWYRNVFKTFLTFSCSVQFMFSYHTKSWKFLYLAGTQINQYLIYKLKWPEMTHQHDVHHPCILFSDFNWWEYPLEWMYYTQILI